MRSKSKWQRLLLALFFVAVLAFVNKGYEVATQAMERVSSREVLQQFVAGVAEITEADLEPTEEDMVRLREEYRLQLAESRAWMEPGALVMADVNDSVNVRSAPNEEAEKVGKLYCDCGGYILEYTDEWTRIESGNVIGWVNNRYLLFGEDARKAAEDVGVYRATVETETLRVRMEPSVDSGIYGLIGEGETFDVVEQTEDWLVIDFEGANGYINEEYVDIHFHIDYGETIEAIEAREQAEQEAREQANRYQNYGQYAAAASDVELLGALIQCEAGNQSYEGKLAVGAVVMNRVRSSAYPNTIYSVIYASGQFTPAGSGLVDRRLQNGVSESCLQAAQEAINGVSNVGSATHFRRAGNHEGLVIGAHVFW